MASIEAIEEAFALLAVSGCRPPKQQETDEGQAMAVEFYYRALADLTDSQVRAAVIAYTRQPQKVAQWWPMPGALLELVPEWQAEHADDWSMAWGRALICIRQYGMASKPGRDFRFFDDERRQTLTEAAIRGIGGWKQFGMTHDDDIPQARANFRDSYRAAATRRLQDRETQTVRALLGEGGVNIDAIGTAGMPQLEDRS